MIIRHSQNLRRNLSFLKMFHEGRQSNVCSRKSLKKTQFLLNLRTGVQKKMVLLQKEKWSLLGFFLVRGCLKRKYPQKFRHLFHILFGKTFYVVLVLFTEFCIHLISSHSTIFVFILSFVLLTCSFLLNGVFVFVGISWRNHHKPLHVLILRYWTVSSYTLAYLDATTTPYTHCSHTHRRLAHNSHQCGEFG